ncbi:helix-turn-helix domain-containing protein [Paenibacillus sp. GCM10027626]|uniref:helix-turn-helix domain-containing protein n=1 Tax=Paenibacillus sp. GCM10027626 TaxID=3273411 RepID=UPI00362B1CD3
MFGQEFFAESVAYLNSYSLKSSGSALSFHIHYWGSVLHFDHPLHKHSFYEACYVTGGSGTYVDNGISYSLSEGSMFLSRPGIWHKINGQNEVGISLVYVAFELEHFKTSGHLEQLNEHLTKCEHFYIEDARNVPAGKLWSLLGSPAVSQTFMPEELFPALSFGLLVSILQQFAASYFCENTKQTATPVEVTSLLLHQAKLYIRDNLSVPIYSKELANYLHISERHLSRLFASETGVSLSDYIRKERVRKAIILLKTSILSVQEIAEETGFSSVHHFTRLFKKATGLSPGQYRKIGSGSLQ